MRRFIFTILILLLLGSPSPAFADVAPPANPPGSNPQPGKEATQVRMVSETVLIDVMNSTTPESLGSAQILADFNMANLGAIDEKMPVRFPISAGNGWGEYPEIANITIKVEGKPTSFRKVDHPDIHLESDAVPWAEFDVTFPAGKETNIQVSYTLKGTGYYPYSAYYYILETGAGWNGTIGSADIILRLPYSASPQNVVLGMEIGWASTPQGATFSGREVRWHYEDFEPGPYEPIQNMEFALVSPVAWNEILKEQKTVEQNPKDAEAWGRLGRAYKRIFLMSKAYREDPGGEELYKASIEAYETCLTLKPGDAQWHAGFADLLAGRSYWDAWLNGPTADTYRSLEEIQTALELAPNDPVVQEIAANISGMFPEGMVRSEAGYEFPWLIQTPTPVPPTPTIAPFYNPVDIIGEYRSSTLTLASGDQAKLVFSFLPDQSASLITVYPNDPSVTYPGRWTDEGDGTLRVAVEAPGWGPLQFSFQIENDQMTAVEYPSIYGEEGIIVTRSVRETPVSTATVTVEPLPSRTTSLTAAATITSAITPPAPTVEQPSPSSRLPICGSAALAPLLGLLLIFRKRSET